MLHSNFGTCIIWHNCWCGQRGTKNKSNLHLASTVRWTQVKEHMSHLISTTMLPSSVITGPSFLNAVRISGTVPQQCTISNFASLENQWLLSLLTFVTTSLQTKTNTKTWMHLPPPRLTSARSTGESANGRTSTCHYINEQTLQSSQLVDANHRSRNMSSSYTVLSRKILACFFLWACNFV